MITHEGLRHIITHWANLLKMKYDFDKEVKDDIQEVENNIIDHIIQQEAQSTRLAKVEELLALYQEYWGLEVDIEYLSGLRDCMVEYSVEAPMSRIYSGIKEYKERKEIIKQKIDTIKKELEDQK